jgi:nucleoid DNA-binding protein
MNYAELLEKIASKSDINKSKVKSVIDLFLEEVLDQIDSNVSVRTSQARIFARHRKAKSVEADGSSRHVPERFYGIIERAPSRKEE